MPTLTLDPNLAPKAIDPEELKRNRTRLLDNMTDRKSQSDWDRRTITATWSQELVEHNLSPEAPVTFTNYLLYLDWCYRNHEGVVLRPDDIWYVLVSQLAGVVKEDPKAFAHLFTDTPEKKQTLVVCTLHPYLMPVHRLVDLLKSVVPSDVTLFLPNFTTTQPAMYAACCTAFADMVSPYYDYCMMCCGIPRIRVEGTREDWTKLHEKWVNVVALLKLTKKEQIDWAKSVADVLHELAYFRPVQSFWKDMFYHERCGSGSDMEVRGWFARLYLKQPELAKACNFATCISEIKYKNLETQKNYVMKQGCFTGTYEVFDGVQFLVPQYNWVVMEQLESQRQETSDMPPPNYPQLNPKFVGRFPVETEEAVIGKPLDFRVAEEAGSVVSIDPKAMARVDFS